MSVGKKRKGLTMHEGKESFFERLLGDSSEHKDEVREYVSHRLKQGANVRDVVKEDYVQRNSTKAEIDEIMRDPRVVHQAKEGLEQDFESDELKPEHPPQH